MASYIQRRKFLATLPGGAAAWPLAARAQQPAMPVVGILGTAPRPRLRKGEWTRSACESGYAEGQNVRFEYRLAEGRYDRMSMLAADLINGQVSVIVAPGSSVAANAAKAATATIPIVFAIADDPVHA
jgi:putative ABC transport system substrate-binding protein